jgi:hypothetical protein
MTTWTVQRRNRLGWLAAATGLALLSVSVAGLAGCFQELDSGAAGGGSAVGDQPSSAGGAACGGAGEVCSSPNGQCAMDSPECFYLCGSPLCAVGTNPTNGTGLPPVAGTAPPIYVGNTDTLLFADGGSTADPCAQVEANSIAIRARSCAPCHSTGPQAQGNFTSVMNDGMLVNAPSNEMPNVPYVAPGNPLGSMVYQQVVSGLMPPSQSLSIQILGPDAGASIASTSPSEASMLYEWILNCVPGTDGGAHKSNYDVLRSMRRGWRCGQCGQCGQCGRRGGRRRRRRIAQDGPHDPVGEARLTPVGSGRRKRPTPEGEARP